ncbi:acyltransferase family protein [Alteromonas sp. 4B03]|uniref:acyltransferase family protein n=3 Tax=unclassified Alteromonas TaxID=2614992 RepID=UPI003D2A6BCB
MIAASDSKAINVCRLLCIFFMTFVHVNPGPEVWAEHSNIYGFDLLQFFSNFLGRASVPALSIISGYLIVNSFYKSPDWFSFAKSKFKKLIVPLITWNLIIILFSLAVFYLVSLKTIQMRILSGEELTFVRILDLTIGLNYNSITEPLNFLRDIFVCSLISPIFIFLYRANKFIFLFLTWTICLNFDITPVIMRDGILMFFSVGIALGVSKEKVFSLSHNNIIIMSTVVTSLFATYIANDSFSYYDLREYALRVVVACAFMISSYFLATKLTHETTKKLGGYSFPLFLSHSLIFTVLWGFWQFFIGREVDSFYPVFYFSAPLFALIAVQLIMKTKKFFSPKINSLLWAQ